MNFSIFGVDLEFEFNFISFFLFLFISLLSLGLFGVVKNNFPIIKIKSAPDLDYQKAALKLEGGSDETISTRLVV